MSIFQPPYNSYTPAELLAHFRSRCSVRYFPVLDAEQTMPEKIAGVLHNEFDFNNERYCLPANFDWTENPSQDIEWLILLHKFYYATGLGRAYCETGDPQYAHKWVELTESWINSVASDFLSSDVAGRRVQNWIFAHYYFISEATAAPIPADFYQKLLQSLHDQVCTIRDNLTPARNHRTIELYAIFLAAVVFPEFKEAAEWLHFSRQELLKNLQTDLLADGVQVELSTDYHHLVLKNYLAIRKLALLNNIPMPAEMDILLKKALEFAVYAHKPDGMIPSLSDGDSRSFLDLLAQGYELYGCEEMLYVATQGHQGRPPSCRSRVFPQSGYTILRSGWGDRGEAYQDERYLIFDCGPLGAGNHGHLDLLSVELAAYGRSLIVDPGRYTYDESGEINWRVRFRGTSYHNTVQVDGRNQTRYIFDKTRFKIRGPEPDHELRTFIENDEFDFVHGIARSHEYPVVHERKILFARPDYWIITDHLRAEEQHDYDLLFHLADEAWQRVKAVVHNETRLIYAPHLVLAQPSSSDVSLAVEDGYISRTYGVKHPAPILRFTCRAADATFHTVVYPYQGQRPQLSVTPLPVCHNNRLCDPGEAFALRIAIRQNGQQFNDLYFNAAAEGHYEFGGLEYNGRLLYRRQGDWRLETES